MDLLWHGQFNDEEVRRVHAAAFGRATAAVIDWWESAQRYSLGWVTARNSAGTLVGFCNVLTDGHTHAWLQDVVVDPAHQRSGVGTGMINLVRKELAGTGMDWLHVDFDSEHGEFYFGACGFRPTDAGLLPL